MGQVVIEFISSFVSISGNDTVDTILFFIIGSISFSVAWGFVGNFFDLLGFYDSDLMSDTHWIVRTLVFSTLTYVMVKIFQFLAWLLSFPWWVYFIIVIIIIVGVILFYYIQYHRNKSRNIGVSVIVDSTIEDSQDIKPKQVTMEPLYHKDSCPRCNSKLVKRQGPYGLFVGCSSYPTCTYSRKRF